MQTVCFKEHGGVFHNSIVQPLPLSSVPWWTGLGSQVVYGESFGQMKGVSMDHPTARDELGGIHGQKTRGADQASEKENQNTSQFTIFPADNKESEKEQKAQEETLSRQSSQTGYQTCFELGLAQPMVCASYPYGDQYFGVLATYGTPAMGRIMLPLNVKSEDGPIFVNAKQYHGILRRRQSRAKAELENKLIKVRKPYLHESRHLHALRRARGCGGRFLTKNGKGETKEKSGGRRCSPSSGSSTSEVLQNLGTSKEFYGGGESNLSGGSEVTSMYHIDHLRSSAFHSLSNMIDSGQNNRWVATADGCCDLLKV